MRTHPCTIGVLGVSCADDECFGYNWICRKRWMRPLRGTKRPVTQVIL